MKVLYQNVGARFTSTTGQVIERGTVFEPTVEDLNRRRWKLRLFDDAARGESAAKATIGVSEPTPPAAAGAAVPPAVSPPLPPIDPNVWPLVMRPEMYLRLHPTGPNAALARRILGEDDDGEPNA